MSADFSRLLRHLGANLQAHADAEFENPVRRVIFLARGGHAPGEECQLDHLSFKNASFDCPFCGEPMYAGAGPDGLCTNGHEWWDE